MIANRILDLISNINILEAGDIKQLEKEIEKYPYMQSLRAIKLLAVNKFSTSDYASQLATTAAFTTDKKILYQLVNQNSDDNKISDDTDSQVNEGNLNLREEDKQTDSSAGLAPVFSKSFEIENHPAPRSLETIDPVRVNGKVNRILFLGEEDFLERAVPKIDFESSRESGNLVLNVEKYDAPLLERNRILEFQEKLKSAVGNSDTKKQTGEEKSKFNELSANQNFNADETSVVESDFDKIESAESTQKTADETDVFVAGNEAETELSFHNTDEFLPHVSFTSPRQTATQMPIDQPVNRHEEERLRLIAEVEAKMKKSKKTPEPMSDFGADEPQSHDISFAETMDFVVKSGNQGTDNKDFEELDKDENLTSEPLASKNSVPFNSLNTTESTHNSQSPSEWKPMTFGSNGPELETVNELSVPVQSNDYEVDISQISVEASDSGEQQESNVPKFINTWQSWLKLGKINEIQEIVSESAPAVVKSVAIEKFIENEPKISRLNEDSSFVVREKSGDISHLMTETLANIYVDQRLYTKAIAAFETLKGKFPERTEDFSKRIQEIRDLRQPK